MRRQTLFLGSKGKIFIHRLEDAYNKINSLSYIRNTQGQAEIAKFKKDPSFIFEVLNQLPQYHQEEKDVAKFFLDEINYKICFDEPRQPCQWMRTIRNINRIYKEISYQRWIFLMENTVRVADFSLIRQELSQQFRRIMRILSENVHITSIANIKYIIQYFSQNISKDRKKEIKNQVLLIIQSFLQRWKQVNDQELEISSQLINEYILFQGYSQQLGKYILQKIKLKSITPTLLQLYKKHLNSMSNNEETYKFTIFQDLLSNSIWTKNKEISLICLQFVIQIFQQSDLGQGYHQLIYQRMLNSLSQCYIQGKKSKEETEHVIQIFKRFTLAFSQNIIKYKLQFMFYQSDLVTKCWKNYTVNIFLYLIHLDIYPKQGYNLRIYQILETERVRVKSDNVNSYLKTLFYQNQHKRDELRNPDEYYNRIWRGCIFRVVQYIYRQDHSVRERFINLLTQFLTRNHLRMIEIFNEQETKLLEQRLCN